MATDTNPYANAIREALDELYLNDAVRDVMRGSRMEVALDLIIDVIDLKADEVQDALEWALANRAGDERVVAILAAYRDGLEAKVAEADAKYTAAYERLELEEAEARAAGRGEEFARKLERLPERRLYTKLDSDLDDAVAALESATERIEAAKARTLA